MSALSIASHVGALPASTAERRTSHVRVGEAARRIGVSPSALRLWERQGLVRPGRTPSGHRLYSDLDLARLRRIHRMRTERVSAPGIRRIMPAPEPDRVERSAGGPIADGRRLRALRREHGLSLREASERASLSTSFLSALERGSAGASVATLQRITQVYGVTLLELLDKPQPGRRRRVRPHERPALTLPGAGVRIEQLAHGAVELEPQLFVLGPGATSDGAYAHAGEEFMFVLDGSLTVWVGEDERYRLNAGDALTFPSTMPHRWRNRARGETRLLWINTPPTF